MSGLGVQGSGRDEAFRVAAEIAPNGNLYSVVIDSVREASDSTLRKVQELL